MNAHVFPAQSRCQPAPVASAQRKAAGRDWIEAMVADGFVFALLPGGDPTDPNAFHLRRDGIDRSADLLSAIGARTGGRHG